MLQRLVKAGVARVLWGTRTDAWIGNFRGARLRPLVLGYHRVVPHPAATGRWLPGMAVSRDMLERHLDWLGRSHRFVSLDELGEKIAARDPFARPVAAVTFDDGYADVYENAFPLLRRKGIPAAVFVVTDLVGTAALPLHDRLYLVLRRLLARGEGGCGRLRSFLDAQGIPSASWQPVSADPHRALVFLLRRLARGGLLGLAEGLEREVGVDPEARRELRPVTWSMLGAMQEGGFTVGSHTRSHALLTNESSEDIRDEAAGSRAILEQRLGRPVHHFAYPDGRCDARAVAAVAEAGYRFAYTTCSHEDPSRPQLTIPRRLFWEGSCLDHRREFSGAVLSCQVNGVFDGAARCRQDHSFTARLPA